MARRIQANIEVTFKTDISRADIERMLANTQHIRAFPTEKDEALSRIYFIQVPHNEATAYVDNFQRQYGESIDDIQTYQNFRKLILPKKEKKKGL